MEAPVAWIGMLINVIGLVMIMGAIDALLFSRGEPTVTQFLRDFPMWFWIPWLLINVFWFGLFLHLFTGIFR